MRTAGPIQLLSSFLILEDIDCAADAVGVGEVHSVFPLLISFSVAVGVDVIGAVDTMTGTSSVTATETATATGVGTGIGKS